MKQTRFTCLIALIAGLVFLAGCSTVEPEPTPEPAEQAAMALERIELIGSMWEAEYFGEVDDGLPVLPDSKLTLNMGVERYAGYSGCNWFLGIYGVDGETLRFNTPATTAFICQDEAIGTQGATYTDALLNVTRYEMEGEKLVTYTVEDQKMVTFVPSVPAQLEGTPWTVKFVNYGDGMTQATNYDYIVTARFEDGKIQGFGGCTDYEADYVIDGDSITISNISAGDGDCSDDEGASQLQQYYFDSLEATTNFESLVASTVFVGADGTDQVFFGTP